MNYIEVMKQAVDELDNLRGMANVDKAIANLTAAIEQMEKAEPVAWRVAHAFLRTDFTAGLPSQETIHYWRLQDIELEYAYTHPAPQSAELSTIHEILMAPGDCPPVAEGDTLTVRMLKDYVRARKAYAIPEGWQPMPKEPTNKMYDAWNNSNLSGFNERYKALLAAAPKPEDVK